MLNPMRRSFLVPIVLIGAVVVLIPVAAVVELPGEAKVQELLGDEWEEPCGPVLHRGEGHAWRTESAPEIVRDGPAGVRTGKYVYLVGGIHSFDDEFENVDSAHEVERLDLTTGKWEDMPPLPRGLNHIQVAAVGADVYVLGGITDRLSEFVPTGQSWRFDAAAERWVEIDPLPTPRGAGAAVTIGDAIYVIGGVAHGKRLTTLERYDTTTGTWEALSPMRSARDHLGAAALDGKLYVLGGRRSNELPLSDFERYDPATDSWARLPGVPDATAGFGFDAANGQLVATGGEDLNRHVLTGQAWAYDPSSREWEALPDMKSPMHGHAQIEYRGRVYAYAGSECSGFHPFRRAESLEVPPA